MKNSKQIFHIISYLQYPLMLAAMIFYVPFIISMFKGNFDWSQLNNTLIMLGVGFSMATLQDTSTTQNEFSKKVWQSPTKGRLAVALIAGMAFFFIITGLVALFLFDVDKTEGVAVGITVLGIGLIGILKAAIEMFEHHRLDNNPHSDSP